MARKWFVLIGVALLLVGLGWWILRVTMLAGPDRSDASGYGQFVLAAVGLVIAAMPLVRDWVSSGRTRPGVDELADILAITVRAQWMAAALDRGLVHPQPLPIRWRRTLRPVVGPVTAATAAGVGAFAPFPGLDRVTAGQLREGTHRTLHRVYGGLPSGRLIITGGPGSGKSSAAILLLLDALTFRDHLPATDRARVPVPVLFTLTGWDPTATTMRDWLAGKLTELLSLSGRGVRQQIHGLLAAGRVAVVLDGLDEIPQNLRPAILGALTDQATFRVVVLTRTDELAVAAERRILTDAACIELCPLTPTDAATYLRHSLPDPAPRPWQNLFDALTARTANPVADALSNPLAITLLRDIYQHPAGPAGAPDDLLDEERFPTATHITDHLLDHAIAAAYTPRHGQPAPGYRPELAHHTLTVIACHLRDRGTRDLHWWRVADWVPRRTRGLLNAVVSGLALGLLLGAVWGLMFSEPRAVVMGSAAGFAVGFGIGLSSGLSKLGPPDRLGQFRWRQVSWKDNIQVGLWVGVPVGVVFGIMLAVTTEDEQLGLRFGVTICFTVLLGIMVGKGVEDGFTGVHVRDVQSPRAQRRSELTFQLASVVLVVSAYTAGFGVPTALLLDPALGVVVALIVLPVGVVGVFTSSTGWLVTLCQLLLARRQRIPVRLLRFLDDAHRRHLLRTVGPVYQFRHAALQDRLAPPERPTPEDTT